ncbi:hypothetical protein F3Y22_tig00110332pilonHSYRG01097 [Hibiscus syriacus]|uniref:Uncharacterized protein n=1 Tax=Hibiscus syriacus TaxID=106335 RepID=A0A6A3B0J7_HIBSY|nr:hypothetical protein F3Y22_tig00110332pilonHSYRG01097 [Hibiscus syriacus]
MYVNSLSGFSVASAGIMSAPIEIGCNVCITIRSSSVGSLFTAFPVILPLQYKVYFGSSRILIFSYGRFSHSRAILTSPNPISWRSFHVFIASSRTKIGRHLEFSWMARMTLDLRYPNRAPVILVPPWIWLSCNLLPWRLIGILHVGVMIGNDLKTERKRLKILDDFEDPCLFDDLACTDEGRDDNGGLDVDALFLVAIDGRGRMACDQWGLRVKGLGHTNICKYMACTLFSFY